MIAALALSGGKIFFQPCDDEDAVTPQLAAFQSGQGVEGTDEYTPIGADNASIQQHLPLVRLEHSAQDDTADSTNGDNPEWKPGAPGSITGSVRADRPDGEHWMLQVKSPQAAWAVLRLMDYPPWQVSVNGRAISVRPRREDGLMAVPVASGDQTIDIHWVATRDVMHGRELSGIALLALALTAVMERRLRR